MLQSDCGWCLRLGSSVAFWEIKSVKGENILESRLRSCLINSIKTGTAFFCENYERTNHAQNKLDGGMLVVYSECDQESEETITYTSSLGNYTNTLTLKLSGLVPIHNLRFW